MEKWLIGILCIFLVLAACSPQNAQEDLQDKAADSGKSALNNGLHNSVNLKCTIQNAFTIYFLGEKTKVKSTASESWVIDSYAYGVINVGDTHYIIKSPITKTEMDYTAMKEAYYSSKFVQGMDCEEGVVTDAEMELPDYPIMTSEEFQQKMTEEMMGQYS